MKSQLIRSMFVFFALLLIPCSLSAGNDLSYELMRSVGRCDLDTARSLLNAGANPNATFKDGYPRNFMVSAIHFASREDCVDGIRLLLDSGSDPNLRATEWDQTPLHVAAYFGNIKVVRLLLSAGANPRVKDSKGRSPAALAAKGGHARIVDLLAESSY